MCLIFDWAYEYIVITLIVRWVFHAGHWIKKCGYKMKELRFFLNTPSENKCLDFALTLVQSYAEVETLILRWREYLRKLPQFDLSQVVRLYTSISLIYSYNFSCGFAMCSPQQVRFLCVNHQIMGV